MLAHGAVASRYLGVDVFKHVTSSDWRSAPVRPEFLATLVFLEKLTLRPSEMDKADVLTTRRAGVEQVDLEHAILVCFMFSLMNRLVDAFGADITEEQAAKVSVALDARSRVVAGWRLGGKDAPIGPAYPAFVSALLQSIREGAGDAPADVRAAIEARVAGATGAIRAEAQLPSDLAFFADKVGSDVHALTDDDFERLKTAGWSEASLFEFVFVAAAGAGLGRLELGWRAIAAANPQR